MLKPKDLTKRRSTLELRKFVTEVKERVYADKEERHLGLLKKGAYKKFVDEIIPLAYFASAYYPEDYLIEPVLGNQGYDALVFDKVGKEIDRIEITKPHDGKAKAADIRLAISRNFGEAKIGEPDRPFEDIYTFIKSTCVDKSLKDYRDSTLIVVLPEPHFKGPNYSDYIAEIVTDLSTIEYKAKRVFLFIGPDEIKEIK